MSTEIDQSDSKSSKLKTVLIISGLLVVIGSYGCTDSNKSNTSSKT